MKAFNRLPAPIFFLLTLLAFVVLGCSSSREAAVEDDVPAADTLATAEPRINYFAGVDSSVSQAATALADSSFVNSEQQDEASDLVVEGRDLVAEADSLLVLSQDTLAFLRDPVGDDTTSAATRETALLAFNEGAQALTSYADEGDSLEASALLEEAQSHFERALKINPFDSEARYWLARVYSLRASHLGASEEHAKALEVLLRLMQMRQDDHALWANVAKTYEYLGQWLDAARMWLTAAQVALDDVEMDPDGGRAADASVLFTYYVRGERAFVMADSSDAALRTLDEALRWAAGPDDEAFLEEERAWLLWDDGNLATRKAWDELLALVDREPEAAVVGMEDLLGQVRQRHARFEVRHRLAVLYYTTDRHERAADSLKSLWHDLVQIWLDQVASPADEALVERVREDYGTVTYNLALLRYREGNLRAALAYLLQSEQTGFGQAGRAALEAALMLRNNIEKALEVAERAEEKMGQLEPAEQKKLLRYMVELHRRRGDREAARRYVEKYRLLASVL